MARYVFRINNVDPRVARMQFIIVQAHAVPLADCPDKYEMRLLVHDMRTIAAPPIGAEMQAVSLDKPDALPAVLGECLPEYHGAVFRIDLFTDRESEPVLTRNKRLPQ